MLCEVVTHKNTILVDDINEVDFVYLIDGDEEIWSLRACSTSFPHKFYWSPLITPCGDVTPRKTYETIQAAVKEVLLNEKIRVVSTDKSGDIKNWITKTL